MAKHRQDEANSTAYDIAADDIPIDPSAPEGGEQEEPTEEPTEKPSKYANVIAYLEAVGDGSCKGSLIKTTKEFLSNDFKNHPEYAKVTYWGDDPQELHEMVMSQSNTLKNVSDDRIAIAFPGDKLTTGKIINWKDWQWLIYEVNPYEAITEVASVRLCQYVLKFFNSSYEYVEVPCSIVKTVLKEDRRDLQDIGTDEVHLMIPRNELTEKMPNSMRILLERNAYTADGIDFITFDGIIKIRITQADIVPSDDDIRLSIANYKSGISHYSIESDSLDKLNIPPVTSGEIGCYIAIDNLRNDNYKLAYESQDESIITVDGQGNYNALQAGETYITASFLGLSKRFAIKVGEVALPTTTIQFVAGCPSTVYASGEASVKVFIYQDGLPVNAQITWSIVQGGEFARLQPDGATCHIIAGVKTNRSIVVRATLADDETVFAEHCLTIVGMLG